MCKISASGMAKLAGKTGLTRIIKLAKLVLKAHLAKLEDAMDKHHNVSIGEAKNKLSRIINEVVFANKRVILNSHGRPKAAMISLDELKKFEEMERALFPSKQDRLMTLDKAAQVREKIFRRKKKTISDSSEALNRIRKERADEF
jgi:prevent-host-death family protein